jgi:HlyD family secretion protein
MKKALFIIIPVIALAALGGAWLFTRPRAASAGSAQGYELTTVMKGSIESTVTSSGTLSPISEVSVLSQMSGRVEKVLADYNQRVTKGQVLAQINTDMLKLQELESDAAVKKAQANCDLASVTFKNSENLYKKGLLSEYDLKTSETTLAVQQADLAAAQAALKVIQTELNQYALITSPISGVVIDRNVEAGQSVLEGSSSNATSLFTLSEDLSKMEIKAEVDELDIGSIKVGQEVRFTVDANPGTRYTGRVNQIRLVPKTSNNIVSYYVMITAENRNGSLLPGMTASIEFIKESKTGVAMVPSAALRFQPSSLTAAQIAKLQFLAGVSGLPAEEQAAAEKTFDEQEKAAVKLASNTQSQSGGLTGMMMPGPPPRASGASTTEGGTAAGAAAQKGRKSLWYVGDDGKLGVVMVKVGTSNGTSTELVGADELVGRKFILRAKAE